MIYFVLFSDKREDLMNLEGDELLQVVAKDLKEAEEVDKTLDLLDPLSGLEPQTKDSEPVIPAYMERQAKIEGERWQARADSYIPAYMEKQADIEAKRWNAMAKAYQEQREKEPTIPRPVLEEKLKGKVGMFAR